MFPNIFFNASTILFERARNGWSSRTNSFFAIIQQSNWKHFWFNWPLFWLWHKVRWALSFIFIWVGNHFYSNNFFNAFILSFASKSNKWLGRMNWFCSNLGEQVKAFWFDGYYCDKNTKWGERKFLDSPPLSSLFFNHRNLMNQDFLFAVKQNKT